MLFVKENLTKAISRQPSAINNELSTQKRIPKVCCLLTVVC